MAVPSSNLKRMNMLVKRMLVCWSKSSKAALGCADEYISVSGRTKPRARRSPDLEFNIDNLGRAFWLQYHHHPWMSCDH